MEQRFVSDSALIRVVAQALLDLEAGRVGSSGAVYPSAVQQALDQVGLACLLSGDDDVPGTVPALVSWCAATPLSRWPLKRPGEEDIYLLDPDTRRPTRYCLDFSGAAVSRNEDGVLRMLADLRVRAGSDERFRQCRRLLIESGAVDRDTRLGFMADPEQGGWWELIRPLYLDADPAAAGNACAGCGERAEGSCSTPWCTSTEAVPVSGAQVPAREMRHRVVHPGLGEHQIEARLQALGVRTGPTPGLLGGLILPDLAWTAYASSRTLPEFVVADLPDQTPEGRVFVVLPDPAPDEEFRSEVLERSGGLKAEAVSAQDFFDLVGRALDA
ncbi:HU-CCDC81 and SPOR domain-containing protein [Amycolatopsis rubida]|uniref:pPIWI-RE three-gene island domain-containing protein n=1 Tax=Amycolatopsis rubida TaxID=112413 RepID=A0A1I6B9Y9_9PSEU|nr:HU-CCDC81 and SPOR domain-containing protein [Amycolatopsis rubida]SFQ77734.1 hypothetical protein SAMN05421854_12479 [Amycolatopsis rubida]